MSVFSPVANAAQPLPSPVWKSVPASVGDRVAAARPNTTGDSVSIGKLGQALKGVAAEAFNHLDSKAKGFLENLVNSGKISAKDVALGLRSAASEAAFSRYVAERPQDEEDKQRLSAANAASDRLRGYADALGEAHATLGHARDALHKQQSSGTISLAEMQDQLTPLQEQFDRARDALDHAYGPEQRQADLQLGDTGGFSKNIDGFVRTMSSAMAEDGFVNPYSMEGKAAEEKLFTLGFQPDLFGNAFENFADTIDLPGIGRKTPQAASPAASSDDGPSATSLDAYPPASQPDGTSAVERGSPAAAPSPAAQFATVLDPGRAKSAISLLQMAMDTRASGNTISAVVVPATSDEANANLTSLMDTLKSGITPISPSVKIDT